MLKQSTYLRVLVGISLLVSAIAVGNGHVLAASLNCSWTGVTSNNFSLADNWTNCGSSVPAAGSNLVFDVSTMPAGATTLTNDLNGLTIGSMTFTGSNSAKSNLTIGGNPLSMSAGITDTVPNMTVDPLINITLLDDQTFTSGQNATLRPGLVGPEINLNGQTLTIDAAASNAKFELISNLTGGGALKLVSSEYNTAAGITVSGNNNRYSGQLIAERGAIKFTSPAALGNGSILIQNGATLELYAFNGASILLPITMGGSGSNGVGAIYSHTDQYASGKSGDVVLANTITLTGDTLLNGDGNITLDGSISGNYKLGVVAGIAGHLIDNSPKKPEPSAIGTPNTGFGFHTTVPWATIIVTVVITASLITFVFIRRRRPVDVTDPTASAIGRLAKAKRAARRPRTILVLAGFILLAGSVTSYAQYKSNQAAQQSAVAHKLAAKTIPAIHNEKPNSDELDSYTVSPDMPRFLSIDQLGVKARILPIGLTASGAVDSPNNVNDVGWYNNSALPGAAGASLMTAHAANFGTPGVFYNLYKLQIGDQITIQKGNGDILKYRVVHTVITDADKVDMQAALQPATADVPGLNLITCIGDVDQDTNQYTQRLVVSAVLE